MRSVKPEERPLDEGVIDGPETWRTIDGVAFCHWDRWLLRLALAEKGGIAALAWLLREWVTDPKRICDKDAAEALHLQMVDLQRRLAQIQRTPETVLDAEEQASVWLYRKAVRRVWHSGPLRRTAAMRDTPRRRLTTRALRGHWAAFPVSPARFEATLLDAAGVASRTPHWMTGVVARAIEERVETLVSGASIEERVAIYRAGLTTIVAAMEGLDDSLAEMAVTYEGIERAYLDALRELPGRRVLLRDLVEFVTWEDYGLSSQVDGYLAGLAEGDVDAALGALDELIRELKAERFTHQVATAQRLRAAALQAKAAPPTGRPAG